MIRQMTDWSGQNATLPMGKTEIYQVRKKSFSAVIVKGYSVQAGQKAARPGKSTI